ncbi:MAG: helix-turn-helix domain-containing protein [Bacteroidales bacterium]|jgi:transcriptional regulator with XRE-family HTH domain|nr:helix-turn-helix domain-containing protein [Bacteroidales bacterium]MCI2145726.1 helix-turn-helix domain-containing protein [Bacteroidales bacterium]
MKKNALFEKCLANVSSEIKEEAGLNIDIANKIYDSLKAKNMTQREFATLMGKKESEISRWLTGDHGFTTKTLAKIQTVLGEPIVEVVKQRHQDNAIFINVNPFSILNNEEASRYSASNYDSWKTNLQKLTN